MKQSVIKYSDLQICRFKKMTFPPSLCFQCKRCCPGDTGRRAALRSPPACCPGRGGMADLSSGARGALPLAANQQHAAIEQEKEVLFSHTTRIKELFGGNLCIGCEITHIHDCMGAMTHCTTTFFVGNVIALWQIPPQIYVNSVSGKPFQNFPHC